MKEVIDSNKWTIADAILNGSKISIRFKEDLRESKNRPLYDFQIGVAVPLLNPTREGLTNDEEAKALWLIEDKLEMALSETGATILVMTITYSGMREFVFYAKEWKPEFFEKKVKQVERDDPDGHRLQFLIQEDKKWQTFERFCTEMK